MLVAWHSRPQQAFEVYALPHRHFSPASRFSDGSPGPALYLAPGRSASSVPNKACGVSPACCFGIHLPKRTQPGSPVVQNLCRHPQPPTPRPYDGWGRIWLCTPGLSGDRKPRPWKPRPVPFPKPRRGEELAEPGTPNPAQKPAARPVIGPIPVGPVPSPLGMATFSFLFSCFLARSFLIIGGWIFSEFSLARARSIPVLRAGVFR